MNEIDSQSNTPFSEESDEPRDEVELVNCVKTCEDCAWFWGAVPPYGPFPSFDWQERYPKDILNGPAASDNPKPTMPVKWSRVHLTEFSAVEPAVLRGCRKAPIMTIGINPNMTAFFSGSKSATWAYPKFSDDATYAYYYRHATVYQESLDPEDLTSLIIPGSEIRSEIDGTVCIDRSNSHRWMSLTFSPDDGSDIQHKECAWFPEERAIVFAKGSPKDGTREIPITKNELIVAKIRKSTSKFGLIENYANEVSYYTRLAPVLSRFNEYLVKEGNTDCNLTMGEDVSMHDMVACASPGWSERYDIPRERIADNCVNKNRFMIDQLIQSKPRLVIIVSTSSLEMFVKGFTKAGGSIDLNYEGRHVYDLMDECSKERKILQLKNGKHDVTARLLVTPHFSYENNFKQQSRFGLDAWNDFKQRFEEAAEILIKNERLDLASDSRSVGVFIQDTDEDTLLKDYPSARKVLMNHHYDPYQLIVDTLISEHIYEPFICSSSKSAHLDRTSGPCKFCVNSSWQFPEGCEYGLA